MYDFSVNAWAYRVQPRQPIEQINDGTIHVYAKLSVLATLTLQHLDETNANMGYAIPFL